MAEANGSVAPGALTMNACDDILPARVVSMDSAKNRGVVQADASSIPFGVAQNWTKNAPGTPYDDGFAATDLASRQELLVWGPGATCPAALKAESPALAPGILVGADADGQLVEVTSGWALGWLFVGGDAGAQSVLQVFVHPMYIGAGS